MALFGNTGQLESARPPSQARDYTGTNSHLAVALARNQGSNRNIESIPSFTLRMVGLFGYRLS